MELIKVYLADGMKAKLQERASRESLSSFVAGLIGSYFAEYPGLSTSEEKRMVEQMAKVGDTVTIKKPVRFVNSIKTEAPIVGETTRVKLDMSICPHNMMKAACLRCR